MSTYTPGAIVPIRLPWRVSSGPITTLCIASGAVAIFISIFPHYYSITVQSTVCRVRETVVKVTGNLFQFRFVPSIIPPSFLRYLSGIGKRSPYSKYSSVEEEARYWKQAERDARQLAASNAKLEDQLKTSQGAQPILYYTPRLLPHYREVNHEEDDAEEYSIPAESFVGWHKQLFPDKIHPTVTQASTLMKYFSRQDLHEVYRISRSKSSITSDTESWRSFDKHCSEWRGAGRKNKYRKRWSRYLEEKKPDLVIVFEDA